MTTFKLGSSCSPAKCTSVSVRRVEEEDDVEDDTDPDRLVPCPFDKNHQIRACRFPYHYIKCQKNHPKLAQELKTCPFNARHLMPAAELSRHIANCANRSSVNTEDLGSSEVQSKWHVPVSTWENSECSEDWDKEIEASPTAPFIWGTSTSALNQDRTETRTTNSLPPGLRAPTTLPWKN
ncbi:gametocyte-specific factor 1 isoform X2 [Anguilla rostrata]|uniref:gametocyte-specific factor 1 n=1 Tax=Anguilla anguilla TaxID=7936 RepID=UPI0015AE998B|nr:gametocyte-specific factor 1 [Anguilla anguilla]